MKESKVITELTDDFYELTQLEKTIETNFNKNFVMFHNLLKTNQTNQTNQTNNNIQTTKTINTTKTSSKTLSKSSNKKLEIDPNINPNNPISSNTIITGLTPNSTNTNDISTIKEIHNHLLNFNDNLIKFNKNELIYEDTYTTYNKNKIEIIQEEVNESQSICMDKGYLNKLKENSESNKNKEDFDKLFKYIILNDFYNIFEIPDINYLMLQQSRLGINLYSNIIMEINESNNPNIVKFEEYTNNLNKYFTAEKPGSLVSEDIITKCSLILG